MTRQEIFNHVADRYGAVPEYLWASAPNYAVLRRGDNRKWFALFMDVPKTRLGLPGDGVADILDIRCAPEMTGSLLTQPGFLPAYHMHKGNWITVLPDAVPGEDVLTLLEMSYDIAAGKKRRKAP